MLRPSCAARLERAYQRQLSGQGRTLLPDQPDKRKWGTPEAKRREIERLLAKIKAQRQR
jgi:hypothetical protein